MRATFSPFTVVIELPATRPRQPERHALLDELPELTGYPMPVIEQAAERLRNVCSVRVGGATLYNVKHAERILSSHV